MATNTRIPVRPFYKEIPFTIEHIIPDYRLFYNNDEVDEIFSVEQNITDTQITFNMSIKRTNDGDLNIQLRLLEIPETSEIILISSVFAAEKDNGLVSNRRQGLNVPKMFSAARYEMTVTSIEGRNPTRTSMHPNTVQPGKVTFRLSGCLLLKNIKPNYLLNGMNKFLNDEATSDIVLTVNGELFYAHKSILIARSPVFRIMFHPEMTESKENYIAITDTESTVFMEFLRFLYTDDIPALSKMAPDLFLLADRYNVDLLKDLCELEMLSCISVDNCLEYYFRSKMGNAKNVCDETVKFVKKNLEMVFQNSKEWNKMSSDGINQLRDALNNIQL